MPLRRKGKYVIDETATLAETVEMAAEPVVDLLAGIQGKIREDKLQYKVLQLLSDKEWHCRECEGKKIASTQYAGGGGIQGLQRGTKTREGLVIESKTDRCETCNKKTRWDRWTGDTRKANAAANIPPKLVERILKVYNYRDAIENRERQKHELVVDHRFPMERWGQSEVAHDTNMSEADIRKRFQLLKKDEGGNHNLLKSRACEHCIMYRKRGTPLGIRFWYQEGEDWPIEDERGPDAEIGCVGCGWYDLQAWREALNHKLTGQPDVTS
jgi:hypothetical protein